MIRALLLLVLLATPTFAVEPGERLADPVLEERARTLSRDLRCLVCRNESIDESNAELARDLRILVRERIASGDSDEEVIAFLVDRYGEYVLLKPTLTGENVALWLAGPMLLLIAGGGAVLWISRRRRRSDPPALAPQDEARLAELLRE
jgi:cytochrome c-type biogenesis protein CcmH